MDLRIYVAYACLADLALLQAKPLESNVLVFHYVVEGPPDTPYAGGFYHGALKFPSEYPHKPPEIMMYTPSGRFEPGKALCLSMSSFHPETWNPVWSVASVLVGLLSFMVENQPTVGSIESSTESKVALARQSLRHNCANKDFRKLFPELVELHERQQAAEATAEVPLQPVAAAKSSIWGTLAVLCVVVVAVIITAVQRKKLDYEFN
jgi:ubiquitin-conjugating enzyme E2 J2